MIAAEATAIVQTRSAECLIFAGNSKYRIAVDLSDDSKGNQIVLANN